MGWRGAGREKVRGQGCVGVGVAGIVYNEDNKITVIKILTLMTMAMVIKTTKGQGRRPPNIPEDPRVIKYRRNGAGSRGKERKRERESASPAVTKVTYFKENRMQ